jgi:hypothetical protein
VRLSFVQLHGDAVNVTRHADGYLGLDCVEREWAAQLARDAAGAGPMAPGAADAAAAAAAPCPQRGCAPGACDARVGPVSTLPPLQGIVEAARALAPDVAIVNSYYWGLFRKPEEVQAVLLAGQAMRAAVPAMRRLYWRTRTDNEPDSIHGNGHLSLNLEEALRRDPAASWTVMEVGAATEALRAVPQPKGSAWWDHLHFTPSVNAAFNQLLLAELCDGRP